VRSILIGQAIAAVAAGMLTKTDGDGNVHEVSVEPTMRARDMEQMQIEQAHDRQRKSVGRAITLDAEQRRRIINRHKFECNDLEGIPPDELEALKAAAERRARRAAKRK